MTLNTGARTTRTTVGAVDVEDVRRRHPIEEVVAASGVELHRTGRGWMGCCPFHDDTTASLSVAGVADRFHCFGCGISGDVIDYISRLHGVGFREAVAVLDHTAEAGMPASLAPRVPAVSHGAGARVIADVDPGRGYEINSLAWQWFSRPVAHTFAVSYLRHHRRIDLHAAELELGQALVGHSGHGWTALVDHLRGSGVTDDELVAMDLAQTSRQGRLIDTLRDRLIIPVTRPDGQITGLVGRETSGHPRAPKYRNPTRTPTFNKSECLYRPTHRSVPDAAVVVVEGALDALAITAAASASRFIEQVAPCATLGTTTTPAQIQQVAGLSTEPVVIALDGDQAGADGTLRWVYALCRQGGQLALVSRLPDGLDPADWLARHGPDGLVAFHPTQRHTTRDATSDAQVQAASPHLPGRELAALAIAGSDPVSTLLSDLQRLGPLLNRGALRDLTNGAVAEMTRQGWNRGQAFTRELTRALGWDSQPPPRGRDHLPPTPPRTPHLR
ncbi:CHC2 zinc finger domain-containing protein [Humibacillus xanthopallidus]|uniref:DNA primase catalytic core n=1 Tax=Humibacillus xanthopallidus TaxID=412689 RepID=A0A543HTV3_9MICO|nr:CHC2 zinc finger domain-containing protein [Humibacillus xanthopallidus]TQM61714.1 DNA primase catalytic core [Humibacillus xanthopallidus]